MGKKKQLTITRDLRFIKVLSGPAVVTIPTFLDPSISRKRD